jgi:hypothetical protein
MQAIIKSFKADRATNLGYAHAPSLSAAIRADAEILVNLCIDHGISSSEGSLVNYILGDVNADVDKVSNFEYIVTFYKESDNKPFAIVEVK